MFNFFKSRWKKDFWIEFSSLCGENFLSEKNYLENFCWFFFVWNHTTIHLLHTENDKSKMVITSLFLELFPIFFFCKHLQKNLKNSKFHQFFNSNLNPWRYFGFHTLFTKHHLKCSRTSEKWFFRERIFLEISNFQMDITSWIFDIFECFLCGICPKSSQKFKFSRFFQFLWKSLKIQWFSWKI